jgi:hypothetical protein
MVIKGKFKTFGYWLTILALLGGIYALVYFLLFGFDNTPLAGIIFFLVVLAILLGGFGRLLFDSNFLVIDTENQSITFTNQLTRKRSSFSFDYFDGKLICLEPIKGGYARNLYLVKDKIAVKKITDFMYSNHKQIEDALQPIKDLGTFKYSYIKTWKISLGLPILD